MPHAWYSKKQAAHFAKIRMSNYEPCQDNFYSVIWRNSGGEEITATDITVTDRGPYARFDDFEYRGEVVEFVRKIKE